MTNIKWYVTLSDNDYNIIENANNMLNDNHMFEFEKLLKRDSNSSYNMQNTLYLQIPNLIIPINEGEKHIQILFSGGNESGQWICTYYDGIRIYIFDSINAGLLNEQQILYLSRLLIVENEWNYLLRNKAGKFQNGEINSFHLKTLSSNNVNQNLSTKYFEMKHSPNEESMKKRLFNISNGNNNDNNVNKDSSIEYSEIKQPLKKDDDCKRLRLERERERKRKARIEETVEQKIIILENDRLRKRHYKEKETNVEKKERQEKNLACKKKKLSIETEDEKKYLKKRICCAR